MLSKPLLHRLGHAIAQVEAALLPDCDLDNRVRNIISQSVTLADPRIYRTPKKTAVKQYCARCRQNSLRYIAAISQACSILANLCSTARSLFINKLWISCSERRSFGRSPPSSSWHKKVHGWRHC